MATIKRFEDMEIGQLARQINVRIVPLLEALNENRSYGLKSQLDSSARSVMDNIAEGFERDGNKEFIQFLAISKGSLGEVRSQLYRAHDRKALDQESLNSLQNECLNLAGKIAKFMGYPRNSEFKGNKFKSLAKDN